MIIFNNLWITMKKRKISTYQLREKTGIDSKTIRVGVTMMCDR